MKPGLALLTLGPLESSARRLGLLASLGLWPHVLGRRHIPRGGRVVIAPGHATATDVVLLSCAVPRHFEVVLEDTFIKDGLADLALQRGIYPLRRIAMGFDEENARQIERATESVRGGVAVAIFPQGIFGTVGGGLGRIAAGAQAPVVPIWIYVVRAPRAWPRALLVARRPMPAPAPDARGRRRFRDAMKRRLRAVGALRPDRDRHDLLAVAMDDAAVWRSPARVMRMAGRIPRLDDETARRLGRRARFVLRACETLHCSPADVRSPAGLREVLLYLLIAAPTAIGAVLCGFPILYLRLRMRRKGSKATRRVARMAVGTALAPFWGVLLAALGWVFFGTPGLLLPGAALGGLLAMGVARQQRRRLRCTLPVRRHRARLMPALDEISRSLGATRARR